MAGTFPKQEQQSRANEVSRAAGLTLDGGESTGKVFALVAMARCAASAVFSLAAALCFQQVPVWELRGAVERRKFCKSLISG
jgi:hypothetical protein